MCFEFIIDVLYIITPDYHVANKFVLEYTSSFLSLKRNISSTDEAYLWHLHL